MKRILMLMTLALMLAAAMALSGVAQAGASTTTLASPKPITYVCANKTTGQLFYLPSCAKSQTSTSVTSSSTQFKACYLTSNGVTRKVSDTTKCSDNPRTKENTISKVPADSDSLYFCVKSSDGTIFFKGTTAPTCPTGQYAVVIGPHNQAPTAAGDSYSVAEDGTLSVPSSGVLTNDSDPDGDTITAQRATGPSNGTLMLNPDGSFSYTPNADYNGPDSFTYKASDGKGGEATATVSITVNAVNDAPLANKDSATVDAGGTVDVDVLANDSDVDGDTLNAVLVSEPSNGTLTLNSDGSFSYTHDGGDTTSDSFTYKASDGTAESNEATVTITVNGAAQCEALAIQTLGSSFVASNYTFHAGTAAGDTFTGTDGQSEVFCGFGGNDSIRILQAGDIFLGGAGNDSVFANYEGGTFYGGADNDSVGYNYGTFNGEAGDDSVTIVNYGAVNGGDGNDSVNTNVGTFNGEAGDDSVTLLNYGTFNGGDGNDSVNNNNFPDGTFNGGDGDDSVNNNVGTFNGGAGNDSVTSFNNGTTDSVENLPGV